MTRRLALIFGAVFILGIVSAKPIDKEDQSGAPPDPSNENLNEIAADISPKIVNNPTKAQADTEAEIETETTPGSELSPEIQDEDIKPTESSPFDFREEQITDGIQTVAKGAKELVQSLEKIIRGAVRIPFNSQVRSTADSILDTIFGPLKKN
ncbi:unnamed protein product [Allacma fusca]|uniref:Uncharacterized protein n=1 Tax=Allacma fusca TaxID=39272 RepID=A0A8J2L3S8_9HEXA|nr:unnamed protein product [Allacma fusca]